MQLQLILHVWIHQDNDLVDLTITHVTHTKGVKPSSEVIHTNKKHPFLTVEKGFLPVRQIKLGMHVVEAGGQLGVISGWKVVPGVKTMYNLEVAHDHTFVVGVGMWVVHNCTDPNPREQYVSDNLDTLVPDHGGDVHIPTEGEYGARFNGSTPDLETKNAIIEVTGAQDDGSMPSKLASGGRGFNQLTNFVKGANSGQSVYLLYEGDTSLFDSNTTRLLSKWGIRVVPFSTP